MGAEQRVQHIEPRRTSTELVPVRRRLSLVPSVETPNAGTQELLALTRGEQVLMERRVRKAISEATVAESLVTTQVSEVRVSDLRAQVQRQLKAEADARDQEELASIKPVRHERTTKPKSPFSPEPYSYFTGGGSEDGGSPEPQVHRAPKKQMVTRHR